MQTLSKWGNFTTAAAAAANGTTANKTVQVHIGPSHEATTNHDTPIGSGVKQNRKKSKRNSKRKPKKRTPKRKRPKRKTSKKKKKV